MLVFFNNNKKKMFCGQNNVVAYWKSILLQLKTLQLK